MVWYPGQALQPFMVVKQQRSLLEYILAHAGLQPFKFDVTVETSAEEKILRENGNHSLTLVAENDVDYFVGLTPYDKLLGIDGVVAAVDLSSSGHFLYDKYQEFLQHPTPPRPILAMPERTTINEKIEWNLTQKKQKYILETWKIESGIYAFSVLGAWMQKGNFHVSHQVRVLTFREPFSSLTGLTMAGLEIRIPKTKVARLKRIGKKKDFLTALRELRKDKRKGLKFTKLEDKAPRIKRSRHYERARHLLRTENWPVVAKFLSKIPAASIRQLAEGG